MMRVTHIFCKYLLVSYNSEKKNFPINLFDNYDMEGGTMNREEAEEEAE